MRVVRTSGPEHHALEAERLYREVYDLAFAQQLKNKDIPEGGSKAVVLAEPGTPVDHCVKVFADGLLDLISPASQLMDRIARPSSRVLERIYLGPDENISPEMIEWIVERARHRGYPTPDAFMSSKPDTGINHKVYGVTSEGVTVFLEEALRAIGIDPRHQPFTVKITGGPDGDVAGNEIKILSREFGESARIVGIADGSGCGEDPDGLDHGELLRLFRAALPIAHFDRSKLGPRGRIASVDEPDGIKLRNTMHNRIVADAFIPAGGRPATINENNWRAFLKDGKPTSRVIVEGANLFLTPSARTALSREAGVLIVKDSSANKCGVICSSFEIAASLLLSSDQFRAVKEPFVAQVLDRLRELARSEAQLLLREHRRKPDLTLPELSVRLSRAILHATHAIEVALPSITEDERILLDTLIAEHLPPILLETAEASPDSEGTLFDRLYTAVPPGYLSSLVAARLATTIAYREGLDFLADLDQPALARLALDYLRQEQRTQQLVAEVAASDLPDREYIAEILRAAGSRAGLHIPSPAGD
ncbi:MAG: NAD-glutamate dehydrogenase domain-containing protein, partial [Myxococcota bacterium]